MAATRKVDENIEEKKPGYVTIELFKDTGKYKDDVFVCVNGIGYQIQRGKRVDVPEAVAEVLENQIKQDRYAAAYSEQLEQDFLTQLRRIG